MKTNDAKSTPTSYNSHLKSDEAAFDFPVCVYFVTKIEITFFFTNLRHLPRIFFH